MSRKIFRYGMGFGASPRLIYAGAGHSGRKAAGWLVSSVAINPHSCRHRQGYASFRLT